MGETYTVTEQEPGKYSPYRYRLQCDDCSADIPVPLGDDPDDYDASDIVHLKRCESAPEDAAKANIVN